MPFNYAEEEYYNSKRRLFTNPRASGLKYLHVHFTQLMPNQAYAKHIDQYDTAIVVLDGQLTVMDKTLGRGGVFFTGAANCTSLAISALGNAPTWCSNFTPERAVAGVACR